MALLLILLYKCIKRNACLCQSMPENIEIYRTNTGARSFLSSVKHHRETHIITNAIMKQSKEFNNVIDALIKVMFLETARKDLDQIRKMVRLI